MSRKFAILTTIAAYLAVGTLSLILFQKLHTSPVVAGETKDITLSSPFLAAGAPTQENRQASEASEALPSPEAGANAAPELSAGTVSNETASKEAPALPALYTYQAIHKEGRLFIRKEADISAPILGALAPGDTGDVLDLGDEWALIITADGSLQGYVSKTYLSLKEVE